MSRALSVVEVSKRFTGARPVLDRLSLEVPAGASVSLLGASGGGKSTLLRLVAGLERPDAGRIVLGGTLLNDPAPRVPAHRRGVGLVFQELELWPQRTAAENVAFGLPGRPTGRAALEHPRVRALAERLGIGSVLARRPERLSGGERQRVALARTLAPEPDVLLLDEPLSNLDAERRAELVGLLRALSHATGTTTLLVTHDPAEALALGDEVAVLHAGRIVEQGPGQRLYAAPRTWAAARALGTAQALPATREGSGWRTALGLLEAARQDDSDARSVLLRPEALRVEGADGAQGAQGALAQVRAVWPRAQDFAVEVELAGRRLEARCDAPPRPGQAVRLHVVGAVVGLTTEDGTERPEEHAA